MYNDERVSEEENGINVSNLNDTLRCSFEEFTLVFKSNELLPTSTN